MSSAIVIAVVVLLAVLAFRKGFGKHGADCAICSCGGCKHHGEHCSCGSEKAKETGDALSDS